MKLSVPCRNWLRECFCWRPASHQTSTRRFISQVQLLTPFCKASFFAVKLNCYIPSIVPALNGLAGPADIQFPSLCQTLFTLPARIIFVIVNAVNRVFKRSFAHGFLKSGKCVPSSTYANSSTTVILPCFASRIFTPISKRRPNVVFLSMAKSVFHISSLHSLFMKTSTAFHNSKRKFSRWGDFISTTFAFACPNVFLEIFKECKATNLVTNRENIFPFSVHSHILTTF